MLTNLRLRVPIPALIMEAMGHSDQQTPNRRDRMGRNRTFNQALKIGISSDDVQKSEEDLEGRNIYSA